MAQIALTQVRAAFNKDHSLLGKHDPYCVIEVEGRRVESPVIKDGGLEVAWDGTFTIPVTTQNLSRPLKIEVYNKHSLMPDSLIGIAELPLSKLGGQTNVPLFDKKGNPTGNLCFVSQSSSALTSQGAQGAQYVGSGTTAGDEHRHGHTGPVAGAAAAAGGAGLLHKDREHHRQETTTVNETGVEHRHGGVGAAIENATGLGRHKHGHDETVMGTQTGTQQTGSAYNPATGGTATGQSGGGHLGRDAALAGGAVAGAASLGHHHQQQSQGVGQGVGSGTTLGTGTGTQTGATTYGNQVGSGGMTGQQGLSGQGMTGQQGTTGQGIAGQGVNSQGQQGHLARDAALAGGAAATAAGLGHHHHRDQGMGQGGVQQGSGYGAHTEGANVTRDMGNLHMNDGQQRGTGTGTGGIGREAGLAGGVLGAVTGHNGQQQQRGTSGTAGSTGTGCQLGTGHGFGAGAQGSPAASKWASMEQFLRDECRIQDPQDLLTKFTVNKVDVDALFLLKPTDLSGLSIPLGDMRKIEAAMERYRSSGAGNILGQSAQQSNFTRPGDYQQR